jgi:hypothetical protein
MSAVPRRNRSDRIPPAAGERIVAFARGGKPRRRWFSRPQKTRVSLDKSTESKGGRE